MATDLHRNHQLTAANRHFDLRFAIASGIDRSTTHLGDRRITTDQLSSMRPIASRLIGVPTGDY